jgi:DNA replication protein DnaC
LLEHEITQGETTDLLNVDEANGVIKYFKLTLSVQQSKQKGPKEYKFDKVFGPKTTQEQLFNHCNIPFLLDKTIEGYHATLFVYGQTGVGKTYTMEGYGYSMSRDGIKPIIKVLD